MSKPITFLRGKNLLGANLIGRNLRKADLRKTILAFANLEGADLEDADLRGAILVGANLRRANLAGANLEGAMAVTKGIETVQGLENALVYLTAYLDRTGYDERAIDVLIEKLNSTRDKLEADGS